MKFGQYELLERIAMGGMAEVYKGRVVGVEGFEKLVAIKRILPDFSEDERFVKMLLTEARIHSALSHRNIVQIHDLGISEEGEYFIVLEYVEGYDLRAIMEAIGAEGEILPEALSLHIAAEVAQALHFAHELRGPDGQPLGLVHRDVSPSNVLISFAGEVKLSDFGLAKRRHDRSVVGSLKGNLIYMSPEQARQVSLDRRTDVFSLGAVLFELLTGQKLRDIRDEIKGWSEVAAGVVRSARSVRPDLPESFVWLLEQALAVDPAHRFADAGKFGAAARQILAQMNTPVGPSDLQALLSLVTPRKLRNELERSKVIRLGPEARPARSLAMSFAPLQPAPKAGERLAAPSAAPGQPQPARALFPAIRPVVTARAAFKPAVADEDMPPTPPPVAVARPAAESPASRSAPPAGGADAPTPPPTRAPIGGARPAGAVGAPTPSPARTPSGGPAPGAGVGAPALSARTLTGNAPPSGGVGAPAAPSARTLTGNAPPSGGVGAPAAPPAHTLTGSAPPTGGAAETPVVAPTAARLRQMTPSTTTPAGPGPIAAPRSRSRQPTPNSPATPPGPTPPPRAPGPSTPPLAAIAAAADDGSARVTPPGPIAVSRWEARPTAPVPAWDPAASQETPPPLEPTAPPPPRYAPAQPWQPPAATATAWPPQAETWQASASPWQQQAPAAPAWPQQAAGFPDPSPPRAHIQTAKVQVLPTRGLWRPVLVSVAALLVLAASAVHLTFVPLDVLFTWRTPAPLYVASEPEGAIVKLDGVPLPDVTPTKIPIHRDRADHVIEMARPGFRSARDVVRFDRSVTLSIVISLQREGGIVIAPVSPEPSPAPALPAAAAPVGADGEATGKPGARPE